MKLTRRDFIKSNAVAAAAATAGITVPGLAQAAPPKGADGVQWDRVRAATAVRVAAFSSAPRMAASSRLRVTRKRRLTVA